MSCAESIVQLWAYCLMAIVGLATVLVVFFISRVVAYDRDRKRRGQ